MAIACQFENSHISNHTRGAPVASWPDTVGEQRFPAEVVDVLLLVPILNLLHDGLRQSREQPLRMLSVSREAGPITAGDDGAGKLPTGLFNRLSCTPRVAHP